MKTLLAFTAASMAVSQVSLLAFTSLASAAAPKETVLHSFQEGIDGGLPAGGVVFDKHGNLYGATESGGSPGIGMVFQLAPPTKNGDPWTETNIHSFQSGSDGDIASSGVISDPEGNLYGVTEFSGTGNCMLGGQEVGCGVAYELSPPSKRGGAWTETVIYTFQGGSDGEYPYGNLVLDNKGNLYGTTEYGGGSPDCLPSIPSCGTAFALSPPMSKGDTWTEKVLHRFKGGTDGGFPNGQLVLDQHGALYGTAYLGGNNGCQQSFGEVGCGTAFELKPGKGGLWKEKILHRFTGENSDGANPDAGLIFDSNGNLYGTTVSGGKDSLGTVFELAAPGKNGSRWKEALVYSFDGNDGSYPQANLTLTPSGDLYGDVCCGGISQYGTVFRLKPPKPNRKTWTYSVAYFFQGAPDGAGPAAGLILDGKGNLYGTTFLGGTATNLCGFQGVNGCGTVFQIKP